MKLLITKQIGTKKHTFEFEGQTFHEVVMDSQKLSFPDVTECGICGKNTLVLGARQAGDNGEYEYTYIKCLSCKGELTFGQKKKGDVYYLRKTEDKKADWKKYEPQGDTQGNKHRDDNDEAPF